MELRGDTGLEEMEVAHNPSFSRSQQGMAVVVLSSEVAAGILRFTISVLQFLGQVTSLPVDGSGVLLPYAWNRLSLGLLAAPAFQLDKHS